MKKLAPERVSTEAEGLFANYGSTMSDGSVPEIRLSDQERDQVIGQLSLAMSDGRIDVREFEERSRLVYAAKVPSDLEGVLAGLPVTAPTTLPARSDATGAKRWFVSLIGDRTQRGDLDMGDVATSLSLLGDTTFDLTQVSAPSVHLRVFSALGDVTILVRRGTRVRSNVFLILGDRDETSAGPVTPDGLDLRLRVVALLGDVRVRTIEA